MDKSIKNRLDKIQEKILPKTNWTETRTVAYVYKGKVYKPDNDKEESIMYIYGLCPDAI